MPADALSLPDIVLIDAMGLEDVPGIFMTGFDETEHVVRALASGGVDFIAKPVPLDELLARIKVHLANARKSLDKTGRRIVACDTGGMIQWTTPQASQLLTRSGLQSDEGDRLP